MFDGYTRKDLIDLIEGMRQLDRINEAHYDSISLLARDRRRLIDRLVEQNKNLHNHLWSIVRKGIIGYIILTIIILFLIIN